jgi:hypothetical protein
MDVGNPPMNRQTRGVLLVGSLAVVTVVLLATALTWGVAHQHCKLGFPTVMSCTFTW